MSTYDTSLPITQPPRLPILALLHPREHTRAVVLALALGLLLWAISVRLFGARVWVASAAVLGLLLVPGVLKWRADLRRYGAVITVLGMLLAAQGFHSIEHLAQWVQYHLLGWPPFASSGLISAANAEWVHFVWNWGVVVITLYLVRGGMRNAWAWLLLAWALAHTLEHTYMMARYLMIKQELAALGFGGLSAQGLPGILGRDGWLARQAASSGLFFCRLPGLTTAPRLDIHFWWNIGEIALLLPAAHVFLRRSVVSGQREIEN
jgi:hypothetical protein